MHIYLYVGTEYGSMGDASKNDIPKTKIIIHICSS